MDHSFRFLQVVSLLGLVLVSVGTGQAQTTNNFTGATAGQWNVGTNWSLGTVPTSSQDVFSANGTEARIGNTTAAVAGNLTIGGASGTSIVALRNDSPNSLTVSGNITLAPGAGTGQLSLGVGAGPASTLTIGGGSGSILDGGGGGAATIAIFGHMGTLGLATAAADNLNVNQNSSGSLTIGSGQTYTIGTTRVGSTTANVTDALTVNGTLVSTTINPGASAANGTNNATFTLNNGGLLQATTLRRTGSQNITFDWNGGTIQTKSGGNLTVDATSGTLTIGLAGAGTQTFEADSGRTITVASTATLVDKAGENGTLTKAGAGVLALNGSNTHSGVTTVNAGTLQLGHVNALQNSTLDTGTSGSQSVAFTAAGTNTYNLGGLKGSDDLGIGANTISVGSNSASTTFAGAISGTNGSLTKVGNGSLTLSGNNSYSGTTTVSEGTLVISKTNFTATITPTTMSVAFSNTPSTNTSYTVLTGPLVGGSTNVTVTPSGFTGTFDANAGSLTVTAQSAGPTDSSFSGWLGTNSPSAELLRQYAYGAASATQAVSRSNLPVGSVSSNGLSLTYYVRKNATNLDLVVPQSHTNLTEANSWSNVASNNISTNPTTVTVDGVELIEKTATVPVDGARKFLRLKIAE
jgi:autotransporter-associated beta strand protein